MNEEKKPKRSDRVVVGHFDARHEIIVYREPEVGTAWEAEAIGLDLCAMGNTPDEAARALIAFIGERGISGQGKLSSPSLIVADWTPNDESRP